ncbi:hypothetical protein HK102_000234, partial [Quaeritorhiza haematococci]
YGDSCIYRHIQSAGNAKETAEVNNAESAKTAKACKFFAQGRCDRDQCPYSHLQPSIASANNHRQQPGTVTTATATGGDSLADTEGNSAKLNQLVHKIGSTHIVFGDGFEVKSIIVGKETAQISIEADFGDTLSTPELIEAHIRELTGLFGLVKYISVSSPGGNNKSRALFTFADHKAAEEAVTTLDGTLAGSTGRGNETLSVKIEKTISSVHCATLQIAWFYPSCSATLKLDSEKDARILVQKCNQKVWKNRQIEISVKTTSFSVGRGGAVQRGNTILFGGLPDHTKPSDLITFIRQRAKIKIPDGVRCEVKPADFTNANALTKVEQWLRSFDGFESWQVLPLKPASAKQLAITRFINPTSAIQAIAASSEGSVKIRGGPSQLFLSEIFTCKMPMWFAQFEAVKDAIEAAIVAAKNVKMTTWISTPTVTIGLRSNDATALAHAKHALEKILQGEILLDRDQRVLWSRDVATSLYMHKIKQIGQQTGVFIYCDSRRMLLRMFGNMASKTRARDSLWALADERMKAMQIVAALCSFVNANPTKFRYCITPDCQQVYAVQAHQVDNKNKQSGDSSSSSSEAFQCPTCLTLHTMSRRVSLRFLLFGIQSSRRPLR